MWNSRPRRVLVNARQAGAEQGEGDGMWPFTRWRIAAHEVRVEFTKCRSVAIILVRDFPAGRASVELKGETARKTLIDFGHRRGREVS